MNKKHLKLGLFLAMLIITPVYLYFYFSPKAVENEPTLAKSASLTYSEFLKNVDAYHGEFLLYVKNSKDDNSYLESNLLGALLNENPNDNVSVDIITLDTSLEKDLTVTRLKDRLSIENTPGFVHVSIENGKINVKNTLPYYHEEPFTKNDLKDWLFNEDIWSGPYLIDEE